MHRSAISHARLMRESTARVESALRSDDDKEHLVAHRILESPHTWQLWECEHSGLMRQVAEYKRFYGRRPLRSDILRCD